MPGMAETREQLDTTIEIVTPENIAFHYRVAGPFRRLPAFLVDLSLRFGIMFALGCLVSMFASLGGGLGVVGTLALILIAWFILEWFYGGIFESLMNGQTPGKWMLGLRVLTVAGQPINGLQAVMRNVLRAADMYPLMMFSISDSGPEALGVPTFLLGLVVMACNRRFQRLGDIVCGTMVVVEESHWLTGVVKIDDPRAAQLAEYLPANYQVSRTMAQTLAVYADRRRFLTAARRQEVARHLAEPLVERFGLPRDTSCDLLLCALYYRTFIADRGGEEGAVRGGQNPFAAEAGRSPFA
jgi:uncharacterized RDD family membrane protein YckC